MGLQLELSSELKRRCQLLPDEFAQWVARADADKKGMGLHQSQIQAIDVLFDGLLERQERALEDLDPARPPAEFSALRMCLERELTAAHGIVAIFRYIFAQRAEPEYYRSYLDVADLVAADCYRTCMDQAVDWQLVEAFQFRAPPLTYLNSMFSPAAYTRRHAFGAFRMPLDGYLELKLPISIISLPFHHTRALWSYCSIHHEVGHIVDQDLGLQEELRALLNAALADNPRHERWVYWRREALADAFGLLLGGAAFAELMTKLLYLPTADVSELEVSDPHPVPYVRVLLLAAMLRQLGDEEAADSLEAEWLALYGELGELQGFVGDCPAIAKLLLTEPLETLGKRPLAELVPAARRISDRKAAGRLDYFLATGKLRPPITAADPYPARLVPVAAQLALARLEDDRGFGDVHDRALEFMADLTAVLPKFLADDPAQEKRTSFLRSLVAELDLATALTWDDGSGQPAAAAAPP